MSLCTFHHITLLDIMAMDYNRLLRDFEKIKQKKAYYERQLKSIENTIQIFEQMYNYVQKADHAIANFQKNKKSKKGKPDIIQNGNIIANDCELDTSTTDESADDGIGLGINKSKKIKKVRIRNKPISVDVDVEKEAEVYVDREEIKHDIDPKDSDNDEETNEMK